MLCDYCKKNEATVHITKIVNGVKEDYNLCDKCAKHFHDIDLMQIGNIDFSSQFSFQNILSGIMDYINQSDEADKISNNEIVCKNCGMTYSEFKESSLLGCSECYKNFNSTLTPIIKRLQGNIEHIGKIPQRSGKKIVGKKRTLKLKVELQKAIAAEEYEKAAKIRDEIRDLQKDKQGE